MLVLSRKQDQSILIGDIVEVKIIKVRGGAVRVGIKAPPEISIVRSELTPARNEPNPPPPMRSLVCQT